jgi:hypothetical protein
VNATVAPGDDHFPGIGERDHDAAEWEDQRDPEVPLLMRIRAAFFAMLLAGGSETAAQQVQGVWVDKTRVYV